jgi:hypothetical protein
VIHQYLVHPIRIFYSVMSSEIKEHSHHYWDLVHRLMTNYQDKIEWLKANGDNLV